MDIMEIVNTMQPDTISKLALNAADFPDDGASTPFMGVFVQLFAGATLPDPAAVTAYELTYNAAQKLQTANAEIKRQIAALEASQTLRRIREGGQWLTDLNNRISVLRAQLK